MGRRSASGELAVWMNGERLGKWTVSSNGENKFYYDDSWLVSSNARPLSLSLPLQESDNPHRGKFVEAYFDNLLPDSLDLRRKIQRRFGITSSAPFALLEEIGRDCTGAVQLLPPGIPPGNIFEIMGNVLSNDDICSCLDSIVSGETAAGFSKDDFRISIAGAQEKTAFLFHDYKWKKPFGPTPSTHIFKLPIGSVNNIDMKTSVENEWLCSKIIDGYNLRTAECSMQQFGERKVLIVKRFDRKYSSDNSWIIRIPQEDMCQATGTYPVFKYESDGGPGIAEIMEILFGSEKMIQDRIHFFKSHVLFWLMAAPDGHAKNFSIFIGEGGSFSMTPLYDILSAYPVMGRKSENIDPCKLKMAMAVNGKNKHYGWSDISKRHWLETGVKSGLSSYAVQKIIDEIIESTPKVIENVQSLIPSGFPDFVAEKIFSGIKKTVDLLKG